MLLEMKGISKAFGPVRALADVDLAVGSHEIHGLLGENGAGKSTLMNVLGGVVRADSGEVVLDGTNVPIADFTPNKAMALGVRFIHQELNLVNDLMVFENLFLHQEITNRFGFLDKRAMIEKSREVFGRIKMDIDPTELVDNLETSRKQLVEIAKALLFDSKLIIMDEPTSALNNSEIEALFDVMRTLKAQGVSIIYISHKMPEIFRICDKYTVLRDGGLIRSGNIGDIDEKTATELLVGRSLIETGFEKNASGETLLSADRLTGAGFSDISFELKKGEVLAFTGLHGDGRNELADTLFGARRAVSGSVSLRGAGAVDMRSIRRVMAGGVSMVPRNRKERAIIKDMSIADNISIASFVAKHKKWFISAKEELARYERSCERTQIKSDDPSDLITALSGGNQQKVIVSRWLELDSDVYILDNPTQGIDVGAKFEIYKLITGLAADGKGVILFSAEFPEIYRVADRCAVMYKGKVSKILAREEMTEQNVMYYATGSNGEARA